jgi:putative hydrolase, CocE/NonD family
MKRYKYMVPMRDGIKLLTYVTLPGDGTGRYAILLSRNPYCPAPEADEPEVAEGEDSPIAAVGFASVDQHCRGKGGSEGECIPFINEREDGLDTIAWIERQLWFDGRIYLYGGSYLTYVQLSYMDVLPESVKGASLAVMTTDGSKAFFKNGVFKADVGPIWFLGMHHPWDLLHGDPDSSYFAEWFKYPMSEYARRVYGYDVPAFNDTWKLRNDPRACPHAFSDAVDAMRKCRIPVLLTDGWSEMFFDGMVGMWHELPPETRAKSAFLMGPWSHDCTIHGDWVYPFTNAEIDRGYELQWFLHLRDDAPLTELEPGKVKYYHAGKGEWVFAPDFPDKTPTKPLYLADSGMLEAAQPKDSSVTYTFDPADPPFFPGGPNTFCTSATGFAPQPPCDFRPDVKSFITAPLAEELTLAGKVALELEVSSTADATAFISRLSCVENNGNATIMQDCPIETEKLTPGERILLHSQMGPVCWTLHKGERLRLDIASADAHSYRVHSNYAEDQLTARETRIADNTVYFGKSRLLLPVE